MLGRLAFRTLSPISPNFAVTRNVTRLASTTILKKDINLQFNPPKLAFVLENVFSPDECKHLIQTSEEKGYEPALLNIGGGEQILATHIRKNDRCIIDDEQIADKIWQRIKAYIPPVFEECDVAGLNERLRFLRYDPGHKFNRHMDGSYVRESGPREGERSYITVQVYLNEGCEGGATNIFDNANSKFEVVPKTGLVLVFQHNIKHEGEAIKQGRKYTIRTDVMYKPRQ